MKKLLTEGKRKRWGTEATVHIVIRNQKLYVKRLGRITDFKMFVEGILFSLLRKVKIPDVEIIFNGEFSELIFRTFEYENNSAIKSILK